MIRFREDIIEEINFRKLINVCPHDINFSDKRGNLTYTLHQSGIVLSGKEKDEYMESFPYKVFKRTFHPTKIGLDTLKELERDYPWYLIVGSKITAQAYPGQVVSLVPCIGTDRKLKMMREGFFRSFI